MDRTTCLVHACCRSNVYTIMKALMKEFMEFLKEYKVTGLAIAFIIGLAANQLVKSLVDNIIMALISPFFSAGQWESLVVDIGRVQLRLGLFLGDLIYFLIVALVVFLVAKFILREEKVSKK